MPNASTDHLTESKKSELRRRSTRVPIHVRMEIHGRDCACEGETVVVNLHGALIKTSQVLRAGDHVTLHVSLTGKSAAAKVVFVDAEEANQFGVGLDQPENIWGIALPPDDWETRPTDVELQR